MSIDVMNRIWWRDDLPPLEKFVALAIADTGNDDGLCYIAIDTIATKCGCVRRTVQNSIRSLEGKGLLRTLNRKDRVSLYQFVMANLPIVERPHRGPKEVLLTIDEWDSADEDLFGGLKNRGASAAPIEKTTGAFNSGTGAFNSGTGAFAAPESIRDTLETPSDSDSGDLKSPDVSLTNFVWTEWEALKLDFPGIAGIRKIDESLAKQIQLRAKQHAKPGEDPIAVWRTVFSEIRGSEFLTGRVPPGQGRDAPFKLSLGWLCTTQKFREVINGKYASDRGNRRSFDNQGNRLGPTAQAVAGTVERMRAAKQRGG